MARKRRPLLFEVARPRHDEGAPKRAPRSAGWGRAWFRHSTPAERRAEDMPAPAPMPEPPPTPLPPAANASEPPASPPTERSPLIERVRTPQAAIAAAALVVLLVVAVQAVRYLYGGAPRDGQPSAESDAALAGDAETAATAARAQGSTGGGAATPSKTRPVEREASATPAAAAPAPAKVELKKGCSYVVVQHFRPRDRKAAEQAALYLRGVGVECALLTGAQDIQLIATEPFQTTSKDTAVRKRERDRADELLQRIRRLGREYAKQRSGYAFDQCYLREIK